MTKISKQNAGGIDYLMVGCAVNGTCAASAASFIKAITLTDTDIVDDGMTLVVQFTNENSAGTAPEHITLYSSDQVNYYLDPQLTQAYALAPAGCYQIEYTGTANAYDYISYPMLQVGSTKYAICNQHGSYAGGRLWNAGDTVCFLCVGDKMFTTLIVDESGALDGKVDKTTTVNGHPLSENVIVTKADVGLGNVVNTGDSAVPVSGGTTKFTTGGAYTELAKKVDKTTTVNGHSLGTNVTVSKDDVGLGNVVNTGDSAAPVSGGTTKFTTGGAYTELAKKVNNSEKGAANGVATLDASGRVPYSQLPESAMEYEGKWDASTNTPTLKDGTGVNGEFYIVSVGGTVNFGTAASPRTETFAVDDRVIYDGSTDQWDKLPAGNVRSVNGETGDVQLDAADIPYDSNTTTKAAIDSKVPQTTTVNGHALSGNVSVTKSDVGLGNVVNTGDSATPVSGGTTKFTTGGAYTELAKKVDKETGKGLSTNDFTDALKTKLEGIEAGAQVNTVTGVKGNSETTYRTGNVNITKSNVGLSNVVNTGDSATPVSGGTTKFTTGGAYTELAKKVDKTTTVNGHALSGNVSVSKSDVGLGSVVNTGDSAVPTEGGTTKFTTGGAYTELAKKVDKEDGKILSTNDFTNADKTKLNGIAAGAEVNVQSDWTQTCNACDSYIKNKPTLATVATSGKYCDLSGLPTIPDAQIQSDWTQTCNTCKDYIKNKPSLATVATTGCYNDLTGKPTIPAAQIQSNWTQTCSACKDFIKNKPSLATVATSGKYCDLTGTPTIPDAQIQSDWAQTCDTCKDFIKNKPTLGTAAACADTAFLGATACATDSAKLGTRTSAQYMRACLGSDKGPNAGLGYYANMTQTSGRTSCWTHIMNMAWSTSAADVWQSQIAIPTYQVAGTSNARMAWRHHTSCSCSGCWADWHAILDRQDVITASAVGALGWDTVANRTCVPDISFLAYWNGAYQNTSSNLRYYCGGAFGTAAKCNADCFRAATWTPTCVACAGANGSGVAFGTAATCAATAFLPAGQTITLGTGCATQSAGVICGKGSCATKALICFLNNTNDANGNGVSIGGGGTVIIGAGESANAVWSGVNGSANLYGTAAGTETLYLASDGAINIFTNVNGGYACRKIVTIDTSGNVTAACFCGVASKAAANADGVAFGTAAVCDAGCFRPSTWTPTCVACAGANGSGTAFGSAAVCDAGCFRPSTWTPTCVACAGANGSGTAFGTAATVSTGNAAGCIPLIGTALGTSNNNKIIVADANGKLKSSGCTIGSAAGKTAGSAAGNVPLVGTALGTTENKIVLTNASGQLKPSANVVGSAAYCDASCFATSLSLGNNHFNGYSNTLDATSTAEHCESSNTIWSCATNTGGTAYTDIHTIGSGAGIRAFLSLYTSSSGCDACAKTSICTRAAGLGSLSCALTDVCTCSSCSTALMLIDTSTILCRASNHMCASSASNYACNYISACGCTCGSNELIARVRNTTGCACNILCACGNCFTHNILRSAAVRNSTNTLYACGCGYCAGETSNCMIAHRSSSQLSSADSVEFNKLTVCAGYCCSQHCWTRESNITQYKDCISISFKCSCDDTSVTSKEFYVDCCGNTNIVSRYMTDFLCCCRYCFYIYNTV